MKTEPVRIDTVVMERLRKYVSKKYSGHMYGKLQSTIEIALKEYLDREENEQKARTEAPIRG